MAINVGDKIPTATLRIKGEDGIAEVSTDDLFNGKKVAFFGLPGAFTPT
jgi:peroxiredoxin